MIIPIRAATTGSVLNSTPKTAGDSRFKARNSSPNGSVAKRTTTSKEEIASRDPTKSPMCGHANGAVKVPASAIARQRPVKPGVVREQREEMTMYKAHNAE